MILRKILKKLSIILIGITALFLVWVSYSHKSTLKLEVETAVETIAPKPTVVKENGLPNKHLIQTAFIPQAPEKDWSQPWQDACEEAALLTVDYYYKKENPSVLEIKNSILDMIKFETNENWGHDVNIDQMAVISSEYLNYKTKIIENPTINQIQEYVSQDIPVIITANGKTLFKENKYFSSGGPYYHSAVILGYDDNKQQFTVHDVGTQFGKNFKYSYSLLMESIHDFPSSGHKEDINTGEKRILILLK